MRKIILFTALAAISLASCKKSNVAPSNTFSATIDGTTESFNTNVSAQNGTGTALNSDLSVFGYNGSASGADVLTITLNTNSKITTGTYSNAASSNNGFVSILYQKGPQSLASPNVYASHVNGNYLTTVKITSISNTDVQGTFSAQLVYTDGKTIKTVTDGKFNVAIKQ